MSRPFSPFARIREAAPEDHAAFERLFPELGVDDRVPDAGRFAAEMVATMIVAVDDEGTVLGYAYWVVLKESVHLSHIVVAPAARGSGVGRALMEGVRERARASGRPTLTLNVKPSNVPAVRLYESVGLRRAYESKALRIAWSVVEGFAEEETRLAARALPIPPNEDARIEQEAGITPGYLADARTRSGRVLLAIGGAEGSVLAAAVFDTSFPGAYPFKATSEVAALSLLRALRPHARPDDAFVNLVVMDQPAIADALLARGATLRLETVHMRGPLGV